MATTPRAQTSPLIRELLAIGAIRISADGTTLLKPDGTAFDVPAAAGAAGPATLGLVLEGAAVADATDALTVITQFNALLASLRASGAIAT